MNEREKRDRDLSLEAEVERLRALLSRAAEDAERAREIIAAAQEVWDSVPATYNPDDPTVTRHARALHVLGALLRGER